MESIEEGEWTISISRVEVVVNIVVGEFGAEKFKENDAIEGAEVGRDLRQAESISHILV